MRQLGRRSKIVCTLGPATSQFETLCQLIEAGMDVARVNFSHGTHEQHAKTISTLRKASKSLDIPVAILGDLQGPKIRTGLILASVKSERGLILQAGQHIYFKGTDENTKLTGDGSAQAPLSISYVRLAADLKPGEILLFDDGLIQMKVTSSHPESNTIVAEVLYGQCLGENKGVNMPQSKLSMLGITEKDWNDISFAIEQDVDILALSFVRGYREIRNLKSYLKQKEQNTFVIAKIEKMEAIVDIDNILEHSDGIMVARGDLAVEVGNDKVPIMQKQLIEKARALAKPVITATQMLMSMVDNPSPSRAEASDIANAILDGSDAVMLSNETAVGKHPILAVQTMAQIIQEAESLGSRPYWKKIIPSDHQKGNNFNIASCSVQLATNAEASALTCLTRSGRTAQFLAMHRPTMPIFAFSADSKVAAQLCLTWGVFVIPWTEMKFQDSTVFDDLLKELLRLQLIKNGQQAVMTAGIPTSQQSGTTNTICLKKAVN